MINLLLKKLFVVVACHLITLAAVLTFNNVITEGQYAGISYILQIVAHVIILYVQVKTKFFENLILSYRGQENENL